MSNETPYEVDPYFKEIESVKHNRADHESYKEFMRKIDQRYKKQEEERSKDLRRALVQQWQEKLNYPWNTATLKNNNDTRAVEAFSRIEKDFPYGNLFIQGDPTSGKSYLAYGVMRYYIAQGYMKPSQVAVLSQDSVLLNLKTGFRGMEDFKRTVLNKRVTFYMIENAGLRSESKQDREKFNDFWSLWSDHVSNNDLRFIITSPQSLGAFARDLPSVAGGKLKFLVGGRVVNTTITLAPEVPEGFQEQVTSTDRQRQKQTEDKEKALKKFSSEKTIFDH